MAIRDNQATTRQRKDEIMGGTSSEQRAKSGRKVVDSCRARPASYKKSAHELRRLSRLFAHC